MWYNLIDNLCSKKGAKMKKVSIHTEYIELQNVLKLNGIIYTGGEAKIFLKENEVFVNGILENRRGRKLYAGDQVKIADEIYLIEKNVG